MDAYRLLYKHRWPSGLFKNQENINIYHDNNTKIKRIF
jgi:hypothetical protein